MKHMTLLIIAFLVASPQCSAASEQVSEKAITGYSWLKMTDVERLDYVMTSLAILSSQGVEYNGSPKGYMDAIGEKLDKNPDQYDANVTNILATIIYDTEPESRDALDKFRKT